MNPGLGVTTKLGLRSVLARLQNLRDFGPHTAMFKYPSSRILYRDGDYRRSRPSSTVVLDRHCGPGPTPDVPCDFRCVTRAVLQGKSGKQEAMKAFLSWPIIRSHTT